MCIKGISKFNKAVALTLVLALVFSCCVFASTTAQSAIWNGTTAKITDGKGTESEPFLVSTAEQFAYMLTEGSGYVYKLVSDIYLNDTTKINWETGAVSDGYTPNIWSSPSFGGAIYGNGHMVYGLYIEKSPTAYTEKWGGSSGAALISENPYNQALYIYDLGINCAYINAPNVSAAFVAGFNQGSSSNPELTVDKCYIGADVTVKGFAAGGFIGGGYSDKVRISVKNCACLTEAITNPGRNVDKSGGIIGDIWSSADDSIDNCYSVMRIYGNAKPHASFANNYSCVTQDSVTQRTQSNMQGADALTNPNKMANLGNKFSATNSFPLPELLYNNSIKDQIVAGKIWDGTQVSYMPGKGTEVEPYLISSAEQFAYVIASGGNNSHYKLTADIYINDITKINWETGTVSDGYTPNIWYSGKAFSGTLDGDGHRVYGIYRNDTESKSWAMSDAAALIPCVNSGKTATILNIGIDYAYINGKTAVGGLFGSCSGNAHANADNCYVGANVTLKGYETGAFLGLSDSSFKFENCYSLATVKRGIEDNTACDIGLLGEFYYYYSNGEHKIANCFNANGCASTKQSPETVKNVYVTKSSTFGTVLTDDQMRGNVFNGNLMVLSDSFIATTRYPELKVFCDENTSWNGLAHDFTIGDGTAEAPYAVSDAGHFANMVASGGNQAYYSITDDIYLNELDKINWNTGNLKDGTDYIPNYWFTGNNADSAKYKGYSDNVSFNGTVYGNGYTVYGLLNRNSGSYTAGGLIPAASYAAISDLTLSYSYVSACRFTGGISSVLTGHLSGIILDDTVTVCYRKDTDTKHESTSLGGMVGFTNAGGLVIDNCIFNGTLTYNVAPGHIYGLVGTSWDTRIQISSSISVGYQPISPSHSVKTFNSDEEAAAYFADIYKTDGVYTDVTKNNCSVTYKVGTTSKTLTNVFNFVKLSASEMSGKSALSNMPKLSSDKWYAVDEKLPYSRAYGAAHGDVNADGVFLTKSDKQSLQNTIVGTESCLNADFNRDGKVNICDLVAIIIEEPIFYKDGVVYVIAEFNGYNGYTVLYSDDETLYAATLLKNLLAEKDVTVSISNINDFNGDSYVNILLSDEIGVADYKSCVNGDNITITAGSKDALLCAVEQFVKLSTESEIPVLCGVSEHSSTITLSSGNSYNYVWGDEFYGNSLDKTKWACNIGSSKMGGFDDLTLLDNEEAVKVSDGKLQLIAKQYSDPNNEKIKYSVPASVHTQGKMEYRYGYIEISAKVPFETGVWPSFWAQSCGTLSASERKGLNYFAEIDIFEIFGNANTVVPNIHKWYYNSYYSDNYGGSDNHTQISKKNNYKFSNYSNLNNEFHTYGFEWTPTVMSMYVDGKLYNTFDITTSYDKCDDMLGFQDPIFIIFNNHLFSPESTYKPNLITGNEKALPASYEIDWFRVYQSETVPDTKIWTAS